ncbi:serine/threonine protein kinase-like protein [Xylogone sp. PMI_703]|nr:serine/threonine protein kinase-like protein [Xylogone sp. PMI_703]
MSSYHSSTMPPAAHHPPTYGAPVPVADPAAPPGTFAPGTKIQVGNHRVVVQKYFSEGGFAHVYLVKLPKPIDGTDIAVLKRVAVPDKEHLANMRTEVETMKKLKGHRAIVTYYDSHASQLKGGGYEVFLLMEFCNGGGLIDFMNTRLQNRLTEPEILKIFSDVAEGVACMHYLKPPLLHRDLKVENVLITTNSNGVRRFKLCDFGSTAPPRPAATTAAECRLIEDDVQKHTTLQYRSPEMIDVYRKQPIDEKSDIWALGVLLYKLCYYTTPFEAHGQLAILNASFKFPSYPVFSDPLKKLIASMLKEKPSSRPTIYQALREACLMQGIEVPIKDIYASRTQSETRRYQQLPSPEQQITSPPVVGAVFSPQMPSQPVIPDVVPMRRGRPTTSTSAQNHVTKPSPSPLRGTTADPFAALDGKSLPPTDELSSRFPSLDQFSLLHDHGKFEFSSTPASATSAPKDLSQRITERLADDAFASLPQANVPAPSASPKPPAGAVSRAQKIIESTPELQAVTSTTPAAVYQPTPTRPAMVSTGTMTSPTPPPPGNFNASPIRRYPLDSAQHRSSSVPRSQESSSTRNPPPSQEENQSLQTGSIDRKVSLDSRPAHMRHPSSSRPSLEGGRPNLDALEPVTRTKSNNTRSRPASIYLESNMDYLREKESNSRPVPEKRSSYTKSGDISPSSGSGSEAETNIKSHVDFLRSMEDSEAAKKDRRRSSGSTKQKRSSLPSLSGTKNLLAGKFGDAFKRFESNTGPRTPSPLQELERRDLTPIEGSVATDGRSDDGNILEDAEDMDPEQRRELERRRLSMEEKRVAQAAAEYRKRLEERGGAPIPKSIGGVSRAVSIQNKVKTLLDETQQHSPPKRTAEGYGRYTDNPAPPQPKQFDQPVSNNPYPTSGTARKPLTQNPVQNRTIPITDDSLTFPKTRIQQAPPPAATLYKASTGRPSAPPKPMHLNSVNTGGGLPLSSNASPTVGGRPRIEAKPDMTLQEKEDYIADFSKRFPSLSGIELVETEIQKDKDDSRRDFSGLRTKEV